MTPTLRKHQLASVKFDAKHERVFDMSDAGTGKTAVRIAAFSARRRKGGGCLLVLGPRSILKNAWEKDFRTFAPDMKVSIATAANREAAFKITADAYVTNHDAAKWLVKQKASFWDRFDEIVIDESTAFKHYTAQRSRAACKIVNHFKRRSLLTATPTSNGVLDIWHQAFLLDNGKRLGSSYFSFRNTVCRPEQVGRDPRAIKWNDIPGAEEAVFGLLDDITVRHELDKCADIPPNHEFVVEYDIPPKVRKTYDQMLKSQLVLLLNRTAGDIILGKPGAYKTVTAINAAAVFTKLSQICSGAVYGEDGKHVLVDTGRYELITDLAEQRQHSLVFFLWKHQRDELIREFTSRGLSHCVLDGNTTDRERGSMVQLYQAGRYRIMLAHPQSAAHGLTLTKGTATIWSSPTYNLEWMKQGSLRQRRIGQKQKTETIIVLAPRTIEEDIYEKLLKKDSKMTGLLDLFGSLKC